MPHYVKTGDTPTLSWSLGRNLTGATCRVLVADREGTLVINRVGTVTDAVGGVVSLTLTASELPAGVYHVEVETTAAGVVLTHPSDGFEIISVSNDLN